MRIGNSVGLPAFQNTNRKNPKYSKSKRKQYKALQAFMEKLNFAANNPEGSLAIEGVNDGNTEATNPAEQAAS